MEAVLWNLRNRADHGLLDVYLVVLFSTLVMFYDYPLVLVRSLVARALGPGRQQHPPSLFPPALVVIPTLMRRRDELTSLLSTIESICSNGYPGSLTVVASIDGTRDAPGLGAELEAWVKSRTWPEGVRVFATGRPERGGKPMAIDHGVSYVKLLVAAKVLPLFPPVYVSTDADADLGPRALEAIVRRLHRRNWLTGARPNVVAGALHVRGDGYWRGWRHFFTMKGQLTLQVAREYFVTNIGRNNLRVLPVTGVPGAFYCTWSELFLSIPRYLGYLQTLDRSHWLKWWLGTPPPSFERSTAAPLPERSAGDTDDTVTAYVATMARFKRGHLSLEAPATPFHALLEMLRLVIIERPIQYEPEAKVFTSSPDTVKSLFKQRRRWNSARVELTLRLWPALTYHWGMGLPALAVLGMMARSVIVGVLAYLIVPFVIFGPQLLGGVLVVYLAQLMIQGTLTVASLLINDEPRSWRLLFALPLTPFYSLVFKWAPATVGIVSDVLLFGNITGFAPEWTLKAGGSVRIALLFRLRRACLLLLRSVLVGDVPLGAFWFGWRETPWTPSGFEGWTTGKKPRPILEWPPRPRPRS